ncbi:unnamed protein product [Clonostachys rosea]|uniref:Uncharacterized protein n=1 Tax=Bionectria ochroleuca TaxID=29856 RepID=A0ABY6V282_BIOOC|nr:unnamed protein product [Clonostachys rosea]
MAPPASSPISPASGIPSLMTRSQRRRRAARLLFLHRGFGCQILRLPKLTSSVFPLFRALAMEPTLTAGRSMPPARTDTPPVINSKPPRRPRRQPALMKRPIRPVDVAEDRPPLVRDARDAVGVLYAATVVERAAALLRRKGLPGMMTPQDGHDYREEGREGQ